MRLITGPERLGTSASGTGLASAACSFGFRGAFLEAATSADAVVLGVLAGTCQKEKNQLGGKQWLGASASGKAPRCGVVSSGSERSTVSMGLLLRKGASSFFFFAASALVMSWLQSIVRRALVHLFFLIFLFFLSLSLSRGGAAELWAFRFLSFSNLRTRSSLTSCLRRATRRASRVLPISPRACGSVLPRSSRRLSRRRLFRCRFFSSFAFRSACRALTARTRQVCLVLRSWPGWCCPG